MFGVLDACSGSEQGCIQLSGIMTRTEFDGKCPEVEAAIMAAAVAAATSSDKSEKATSSSSATASTVDQTDTYGLGVIGGDSGSGSSGNINSTVSTQVQALVRSFELKKLNDGAENDEKLDLLLVDVYSSLFLEFGGYLKQQQKQRGQEYQQEKEANSNYESVRDRGGVASTSTYSSRSTLPPAASVLTIDTAAVVESKVGDIESTYAPAPSLPPSASPPLVIKEPLSFGHVLKRVLLLCKQQSAFKPPRAPRNSSSTSAGNGSNSSSSINTATANTNSARVLAKLAAAAAAAAEAEEEKEEEEETAGDEMSSTVAAVDGVVSAIVGNVEEKETIITTEGEVDVDVEMQVEVVGEVEGEFEGGLGVNEGEGEGEEDHEQPATTTNDEDDDNNNNNDMDVSV